MNKMRYIVLLLMVFICGKFSFAQERAVEIAKVALEDKSFKKALKNALDATEDPETSRTAEPYYLVAAAYLELSNDNYYAEKNTETIKDAMKYASKGMSKDKGMKDFGAYQDYLVQLVKKNNGEADAYYRINKISKSIKAYQESFELVGDTNALFWMGKLQLVSEDTTSGESNYLIVMNWYYESYMVNKNNDGFNQEPYVYFADKYWNKGKYDSANYFIDKGRTIFGATNKLDFYQQKIAWEQIDNMPPSSMMLEVIQKTMKYFPTDTSFIKKENALYIYLIRNSIANKDSLNTEKLLMSFANSKVQRNSSKQKAEFQKFDEFVEEKIENVYWLLSNYYFNFGHKEAAAQIAKKYISVTSNSKYSADLENRWVVILDHTNKTKSLAYTQLLIETAVSSYPESKGIQDIRRTITIANLNKELSLEDKGALRTLINNQPDLKTNAEVEKVNKNLASTYIDELIRDKQYKLAKQTINAEQTKDSANPIWNRKYIYLAKEDFFYNYYETRTRPDTFAGTITNGYNWNGNTARCNPGDVDNNVQIKVQNRINYFRRNAGVPDIYLDAQYNEWCQKAAFMMETNRKLDHEPKRNWMCYSEEGATAARYSLLIQNANTTYAVTSFVADNNNVSLGNRRWMLFQNGKVFGHGSTDNYCSIWALDDSGSTDTSMYKNQFVAWPPEGYTPKIVVFKNWSFSIYRDLKGATVTMTEKGKPVALKQHPLVEGYGMPSLVWTPEISLDKNEDREFEVSIKLKDGRLYKYKVTAMEFDPIGY
jgi:hypothetical protein